MNSSALRLLAGSRWRQSMMDNPDCFVRMCWAGKSGRLHAFCYQFGGSSNSGLPMAPEGVGGWRCLAVEKLSQVELRAGCMAHRATLRVGKPALMKLISTPTLSAEKIRKKDSEAVAAVNRRARIMRSVAIECGLCRSGRTRRPARAEVRRRPGGNESKMTGAGRGGKTVPLGHQEPISCDA